MTSPEQEWRPSWAVMAPAPNSEEWTCLSQLWFERPAVAGRPEDAVHAAVRAVEQARGEA